MEKTYSNAGRANYNPNALAVNKKFSSRMQARLLLVFCVITLLLVGLMGRLIYIMQIDGDRYAKSILSRQSYVSAVLPYKRGDILDRNGTILARSELNYRLILDPKRLLANKEDITPTLKALSENFGISTADIQVILQERPESQYVILQKNLKHDAVSAFKTLITESEDITGIWFEEEYVRAYPYDTLACDIIGFTSADNIGYYGIEEYYNEELNGTNGREYGYYDSSLKIDRLVEKAQNGNSIVSTINVDVQRIIQRHIKEFNAEFGSKNIGILIMDPNNGEIFAMASNQEYNLNQPRKLEVLYSEAEIAEMTEDQKMEALNLLWKNDVISYGFEPGSTFKPFTIAAGLEEAIIHDHDTFYCDGKEEFAGDVKIKCNKVTGHGTITLGEALMKSCNDALMQIAASEGRSIFYDYQSSFSFGKKTGIDLPGEEIGIVFKEEALNETELATSSFGQSLNVTMVQMAAAYSSLVNGGNYYVPHTVKQIINDSGATVKQIDKILLRQTVSEETSELLQKYLYQTVEEGTAKPAKVEGYAIGGKTGTAQKQPRDADTYIVSFLGAVPAINPEVVIYVIIDEPQNVVKQDDSSIATKLSGKIMTEILPVLGIFPEGDIDYLLPVEGVDINVIGEEDLQTGENGQENQNNTQDDDNNSENSDNNDSENNEGGNGAENNEDLDQPENNTNNSGNNSDDTDGGTENSDEDDEEASDSGGTVLPDVDNRENSDEDESNPNQNGSETEDDEFNGAAID
ncbi:MAG: hypothetical protein K0S76_1827 [Herbinix sp.]|jgi:stage V sporulation protein D (sporulation-specific penicillin-binding protein)|nr:hypothetical protein [Herbinix sp.]